MRRLLGIAALLAAAVAPAFPRIIGVRVDNVVHPITVEILKHALEQARREDAGLVLMRLNTPGGLLEATREAIEIIVASPVPVAAYVTPSGGRAASAGFFLLQAADIAAMAPGTNTGAASPILLGQQMDPVLRRKAENDAAAALRSLVEKRGRNSALAEKTIYEAKAFTEKEALDSKLIEIVAQDEADLFRQIEGREIARLNGKRVTLRLGTADVVEYQPTTRERILSAISNPNVAFVLFILGVLGVYIEFSSPGLIIPGVAGAILALLGLSALAVLPVNWLGAALIVLALAMFVLEAKLASHGILGAGGAIAMALGAVLLIDGPPEIRIRWSIALAAALPFAGITAFLLSLVVRARAAKVVTGIEGMVGELGEARSPLAPRGKVFVHGEYWDAVSAAPVEAGSRVRVTAVEGMELRVEPESGRKGEVS